MNIRQYFFVIRELTGREIKRKYARSYLGILWSVLNPLLTMAVLSMVFSTMFKRNVVNYPIYLLTGQIIWQMFTGATNAAMDALVDNKSLLIKTKLPKQIFPLSRVYTAFVNLGYSLIAYALMLAVFRVKPSKAMVVIPIIIILLVLFSAGIGYILSIAYVFFADVRYFYQVLLTIWMYLSAIFYPVDSLSPKVQLVVEMNPIYCFIAAVRSCVLYAQFPDAILWSKMLVWGVGIFLVGIMVFNLYENRIMQKI